MGEGRLWSTYFFTRMRGMNMITNKDLKINEEFNYDNTLAIAHSAIDMCFKDDMTYISGLKEFSIRTTIILIMTNVDYNEKIDFKELYDEVLYGTLWNRFLSVNRKNLINIQTLKDIVSESIDKYFFATIG